MSNCLNFESGACGLLEVCVRSTTTIGPNENIVDLFSDTAKFLRESVNYNVIILLISLIYLCTRLRNIVAMKIRSYYANMSFIPMFVRKVLRQFYTFMNLLLGRKTSTCASQQFQLPVVPLLPSSQHQSKSLGCAKSRRDSSSASSLHSKSPVKQNTSVKQGHHNRPNKRRNFYCAKYQKKNCQQQQQHQQQLQQNLQNKPATSPVSYQRHQTSVVAVEEGVAESTGSTSGRISGGSWLPKNLRNQSNNYGRFVSYSDPIVHDNSSHNNNNNASKVKCKSGSANVTITGVISGEESSSSDSGNSTSDNSTSGNSTSGNSTNSTSSNSSGVGLSQKDDRSNSLSSSSSSSSSVSKKVFQNSQQATNDTSHWKKRQAKKKANNNNNRKYNSNCNNNDTNTNNTVKTANSTAAVNNSSSSNNNNNSNSSKSWVDILNRIDDTAEFIPPNLIPATGPAPVPCLAFCTGIIPAPNYFANYVGYNGISADMANYRYYVNTSAANRAVRKRNFTKRESQLYSYISSYVLPIHYLIPLGFPFECSQFPGLGLYYNYTHIYTAFIENFVRSNCNNNDNSNSDKNNNVENRDGPDKITVTADNIHEPAPNYHQGQPPWRLFCLTSNSIQHIQNVIYQDYYRTAYNELQAIYRRHSEHRNNNRRKNSETVSSATTKDGCSTNVERKCARCYRIFVINANNGQYVTRERCLYHYGKLHQRFEGDREMFYTCCRQIGNAVGCTTGDLHVWNGTEIGLNGPLNGFVKTGPVKLTDGAINFESSVYGLDCEMCYTVSGLEVAKVSLVNVKGELKYDTYVRPASDVIDYNTRFSGITEDQLKDCKKTLADVQIDLLSLIDEETILIGHSLENDLRALKIIHTRVIDTSVLYPHVRGFPFRQSLKTLANSILMTNIHDTDASATGGGHDSIEDATTCVNLILAKVRQDGYNDQYNRYAIENECFAVTLATIKAAMNAFI